MIPWTTLNIFILTSWDLNPVALLRPTEVYSRYELSFMPESNLTQDSHHLFESVSLTNFHHLGITLTFLRQKPQKVILGLNYSQNGHKERASI